MCQFFRSHIIQHRRDHPVRRSKSLRKIPHGSAYFAIGTAVLARDELCQFCIGRFDIYRILESFFIIPHNYLHPPSCSHGNGCSIHCQELRLLSFPVSMVNGP